MKYFICVNGVDHQVELKERLGELEVSFDGDPVEMSYDEVDRMGQVGMSLGERAYAVSIEGDHTAAAVTVAGHLYDVTIEDERERAARLAERERVGSGGDLNSVMPGIVVQLLVKEGESVAEGQPLLILEAMKMQNEICAPVAGEVTRIHVAEGEAVASGAKLLFLKAVEG